MYFKNIFFLVFIILGVFTVLSVSQEYYYKKKFETNDYPENTGTMMGAPSSKLCGEEICTTAEVCFKRKCRRSHKKRGN